MYKVNKKAREEQGFQISDKSKFLVLFSTLLAVGFSYLVAKFSVDNFCQFYNHVLMEFETIWVVPKSYRFVSKF